MNLPCEITALPLYVWRVWRDWMGMFWIIRRFLKATSERTDRGVRGGNGGVVRWAGEHRGRWSFGAVGHSMCLPRAAVVDLPSIFSNLGLPDRLSSGDGRNFSVRTKHKTYTLHNWREVFFF